MKKLIFLIPVLALALEPVLVSRTALTSEASQFISQNGWYRAEVTYAQGNSEFVPIDRFALRDSLGSVLYTKTGFGHTVVDVANTGAVVGLDFDGPMSGHAGLVFYDRDGQPQGRTDVGFRTATEFSKSGNVYCVLDGRNGLRVFTAQGEELYNLGPASSFTVSADGSTVALYRGSDVVVFRFGSELSRIHVGTPFVRSLRLSENGARLVVLERKSITLYAVESGRPVFRYTEKAPGLNFISADISSDGQLVLAGLDYDPGRGRPGRHTQGSAYLFDAAGTRRWQTGLKYSRWNFRMPDVGFSSGSTFTVRTMSERLDYRYQERP
jgi:hypothetical protein